MSQPDDDVANEYVEVSAFFEILSSQLAKRGSHMITGGKVPNHIIEVMGLTAEISGAIARTFAEMASARSDARRAEDDANR